MFEHRKFISRDMLIDEPNTLFVFGDNCQRYGLGGQAKEMRGEPNAVGIVTKHKPTCSFDAYFSDDDYCKVIHIIDADFDKLMDHAHAGGKIVWPYDGIGTGLAGLSAKAPKIFRYIVKRKLELSAACRKELQS